MADLVGDSFGSSEILEHDSLCLAWQDVSVGLAGFHYLLTTQFFLPRLPFFSLLAYLFLSCDPGDLGGGAGGGLVGPEFRAPG